MGPRVQANQPSSTTGPLMFAAARRTVAGSTGEGGDDDVPRSASAATTAATAAPSASSPSAGAALSAVTLGTGTETSICYVGPRSERVPVARRASSARSRSAEEVFHRWQLES